MPKHDDDRVFVAFTNLELSAPHLNAFEKLNDLMGLFEYALEQFRSFDMSVSFANDLGAAAALVRTYGGLQAAASLTALGFYTEARVIIRSAYEAAGLARTIAKNPELADKWFAKGEWVPDKVSRAFVGEMYEGDESFAIPYQTYYKEASAFAHPTARSTLPYLITNDGVIDPRVNPVVDEIESKVLASEITALGLFSVFCLRNALADPDVFSPEWHQELARIARDFTGLPMQHLDADWHARENRHKRLVAVAAPIENLQDVLNDHPSSIRQRLNKSASKDGGEYRARKLSWSAQSALN